MEQKLESSETIDLSRVSILADLEELFHQAVAQKKLSLAVRIKELQGKDLGLFKSRPLSFPLRIQDITKEQLEDFLESFPLPERTSSSPCPVCGVSPPSF